MKKKLLSIAIVLAMVLALMPATALAAGPEGYWSDVVTAEPETGYVADTEAKTVEISTAEGLAWFAKQVNEGTPFDDYEITIENDIDLSAHYWDPISTSTYSYVSGKWPNDGAKRLDGAVISGEGNVTISGVYTNTALRGPDSGAATSSGQSCYYYSGFIGSNNGDLTIKNITFSGADIKVTENDEATPGVDVRTVGESSLAVVAGYNGGNLSLENVTVTESSVTGYTKIAGFVGQQSGSITVKDCAVTNCTFNITGCDDDSEGANASPITGITTNSNASATKINGVVLSGNKVNDTTDWGEGNKTTMEDGTIKGAGSWIIWTPWAVNGSASVFEPVASIGDKLYFTLEGALEAVKDKETIKLFDDISFSKTIVLNEDKTITLDLNGKTASYTGADKTYAIELSGGAGLVIDDTAEGGKITANNYRVVKLGNSDDQSASLTLNGGTVSTTHTENDGDEVYHCAIAVCADRTAAQNSGASCKVTVNEATVKGGIYLFGKGAEVEVNKGAVIETTGSYAISGNGTVNGTRNDGNTTITINGGTITQSAVNGAAIYQPQAGTIDISGDPVITGVVGIQLCSGEGIIADITGGTIKATGSDERIGKTSDGYIPDGAAISVVNRNYPGGAPKLTISGGTFVSENSKAVLAYTWNGKAASDWASVKDYLKISDGKFSSTVEAYLATGYDCEEGEDGMFSIVAKTGMEADAAADGENVSASIGGEFVASGDADANGDGVEADTSSKTAQVSVKTEEEGIKAADIKIEAAALDSVSDANYNVEITTDIGVLTVESEAWKAMTENAADEEGNTTAVTLSVSVSDEGGKTVYTVEAVNAAGNEVFNSDNAAGKVTVAVTFVGEDPVVYYLGENGAEKVKSSYDPDSDILTWEASHFSKYETRDGTPAASATINGKTETYNTLQDAVDALKVTDADDTAIITILDDIELDGNGFGDTQGIVKIDGYEIAAKVVINGGNHKISVKDGTITFDPDTGKGPSMINVQNGAVVEFNNLIIDGENDAKHGLNVYKAEVTTNDVKVINNRRYAMVLNGSEGTLNGFETEGNGWGINVENKSGDAKLVVNDADISEQLSIKFEKGDADGNDPVGEIKDGNFQYLEFGEGAENTELVISGGKFGVGTPEGTVDISDHIEDGFEFNPSTGEVYKPGPSVTKYRVIEETAENGEVSVNYTLAAKDQKITITVKPDEGFVLSELKVVYGNSEIQLTKVDDTTYTFNMPAGEVTVKATFTEKEQEPEKLPFLDVDESDWYYDAVSFVYNNGLMIGDDEASTIFAPSRHTTRAEYVTILYRMAGEPEVDGNLKFDDIFADDWYADAVEWAYENKIVLGYSDTEYGPNDVIRREDAATILYRYAEFFGYDTSARADLSGYGDVDEISDYAMEAMQWINAEGFIIGDNVVLEPNRGTERCELAQILMRVCAKF